MRERTWIFCDGATMTSHYIFQLFNGVQLLFTAQNAKFQTFADLVNYFNLLENFENKFYYLSLAACFSKLSEFLTSNPWREYLNC